MTTNTNDFMGFTPSTGSKYETLPEGSYDFVVHGIVGLGLRPHSFEGKEMPPRAEIKVIFEIPEHLRDDGQTELLSVRFPISNNEKSNYYKFCTVVLGEKVTGNPENMGKLCTATGMKELLGKVGTLTVATWKNGEGRSVSNRGFYPLHPKAPKPVATRETIFFNPFSPDLKVFKENLTAWTRKDIMAALNADSFSDELKELHKQLLVDDTKTKTGAKVVKAKEDAAPWDNDVSSIQ